MLFRGVFAALAAPLVAVLAAGTFVEGARGSVAAHEFIYSAWWFKLLWAVVAAGGVYSVCKRRLWRNLPSFLLHLSLLAILLGALLTSLCATQDTLHLRRGQDSGDTLPFKVRLAEFRIIRYPGTDMPQGYESDIVCTDGDETERTTISVNNVYKRRGYRLYQTSYDPDLQGTVLTVTHDPLGVAVTYSGYALLFLSMLWLLCAPEGRYRQLLREAAAKGALCLALLLSFAANAKAKRPPLPIVNEEMTEALARRQVIYNGRIAPLRTLALDFCQKVTGGRTFHGMPAERFMFSVYVYRDAWRRLPIIKVEDETMRRRLGLTGEAARYDDLFRKNGDYRLGELYALANRTGDRALKKAVEKVDERCALMSMLFNGELIKPLPSGAQRKSETLVSLELLYDALPWSKLLFVFSVTLASLLIAALCLAPKPHLALTLNILTLADAIALAVLYVVRWTLQGHVPLSNGYETMLFIALVSAIFAAVAAWCAPRRTRLPPAASLLVTSFTLLVSHLSLMSPEMTPLVPVLQSPWLALHVSVIMISYALFAVMALLSAVALVRPSAELTLLCRLLHTPAVFLLAAGTFIGAVWANEAWGTYWSWDPKETWALITLLVYAAPLHAADKHSRFSGWLESLYFLLAFLSVLFTYFGVNYVLGGMHSYA